MEPINLEQKFGLFEGYWQPKIVAALNDSHVKLVKVQGEFVWHHHENEDELFFVVKGRLQIQFRESDVWINPGEFIVIPKGVEHKPVAPEEVQLMLIEPQTTVNTGNVINERTAETEWI